VVVDDVEDHGQAGVVRRLDEPAQPGRAPVGRLGRVQVDPVVAPSANSRELGHRHDLDRVDAEAGQLGQVRDRAVERPGVAERPDVQLVDDQLAQRRRIGRGGRTAAADDPGGAAQPVRLLTRARVGQHVPAGRHDVPVLAGAARVRYRGDRLEHAVPDVGHRLAATVDAQRQLARPRRPHAELGPFLVDLARPQRTLPGVAVRGLAAATHSSGTSQTAASGGRVTCAENGWSCHGIGSGCTPPRLPMSEPP